MILVGAGAAWPSVATGQGRALPVIAFLGPQFNDPNFLAKFHQGLNELGYFEGRNVAIEYQWVSDQNQQIVALATKLVQQRVALIVTTGGLAAARAAREATTTIPILFTGIGLDPVENGFVLSFNYPGGNATGLSLVTTELISKRLDWLRRLVPTATRIAYLMNDDSTGLGPSEKEQIEAEKAIARDLGLAIQAARTESEIRAAFASMAQQKIEALLVASDPFFGRQRALIVALAARYALPAGYSRREFVEAGGLISYGPSFAEAWRQIGQYAGRILNGTRPEALPVQLQNKYELVINSKTVKALGLTSPPLLHALADEVIE
jgi:putative tryptophan/tyrosine transport system substrate-binding protein